MRKKKRLYRIVCEWDIGDDALYQTREEAERAINSNPNVGMLVRDMRFASVEEIFAAGLMSIEEVKVA